MTIRSETVANVALTILCLVVTYAVADRFIVQRFSASTTEATSGFTTGDPVTTDVDELQLGRARLSAVVVVNSTCGFCIDSAGFYRRLAALEGKAGGSFQTLIVSLRGIEDATAFASRHQLDLTHTRPTPQDVPAKIPGTPTLVLVDAKGRVTGSWVGKLTATQEAEVITAVSKVVATN
jgi:hypothetical protein